MLFKIFFKKSFPSLDLLTSLYIQSHLNQFKKIKLTSFICSPSTTTATTVTSSSEGDVKNDFQYAEVLGRRGENCKNVFHQCTFSLMGILSAIHEFDN